jgi:CDP-4-dehydro-6-deoxyglucose reductase
MSQLLTLSRAARLVGSTRGVLQQKIRDGELATFEGMVTPQELLRVFPQARLEDNSALERLERLKDAAFTSRLRERILPDPEVLAERLAELGRELADTRAGLEHYRALVNALDERLAELERTSGQGGLPHELRVWLLRGLSGVTEDRGERSLIAMDNLLRVMSAHVQLLPSRNEFFVDGNDTILEAALRAGLSVNYGCTGGNCGLCKARVVSGDVRKVRAHDYVLTDAEENAGYILLCSNTAVSDVVVEAIEAGGVQDIPVQHITARVKGTTRLGGDILLLQLQTPRTQRLRFFAGQSALLRTPDGAAVELPIASCPCDDRNLEFHVPCRDDDSFTRAVTGGLRVSDSVVVEGPHGDFVLNDDLPRPVIFVAIGSGFAPIKSLIEHAMALDTAESLSLYWLAPTAEGHYLNNLCRSWSDALDNFSYTPVVGSPDDPGVWSGLLAGQGDLARFDVYLAGPEPAVAQARDVLRRAGLPAAQLVASRVD